MPPDESGRQQGTLADWNDERGFGFIAPAAGGPRAFVHVSAFPRGQRPDNGSLVTYAVARDERNRLRAADVRYVKAPRSQRTRSRGLLPALSIAALFFACLAGLVVLDEVPALLLLAYAVLSGVALVMYRADKVAAQRGTWRTPEANLHAVALLGGWPGALVARPFFRHKTTKEPFRSIFWCTVVANCLALAWFVYAAPALLG